MKFIKTASILASLLLTLTSVSSAFANPKPKPCPVELVDGKCPPKPKPANGSEASKPARPAAE